MTVRDGRNECKAAKRSKQEARGKRDYSRAADEALSGIESVLRVGHRLDNDKKIETDLALGGGADKHGTVIAESNDRGRGPRSL
eukprot:677643-Rhodomonas_salina.1